MIRILIVEDEKPIANLIDWNLTDCGYQCVSVNDGIAAADLLEEERALTWCCWISCCRAPTAMSFWNRYGPPEHL